MMISRMGLVFMPRRFLTAEWRHLAMINFEIAPEVVAPYVPGGTVIDFFRGRTFVSLVGFRFEQTRLLGLPIPWHRHFDELNLRFYVVRQHQREVRRGVVFIKELVPKRMVAWVARTFYNENYWAVPMRSRIELPRLPAKCEGAVAYEWFSDGRWQGLRAGISGEPQAVAAGSEEEFITEHYWGYARQRDQATVEYGVEHPPWRVWKGTAQLEWDPACLYGPGFVDCLTKPPSSVFVADGSAVVVRQGQKVWQPNRTHAI
jgi:uncharacterized protein YqjF (DUF2071 family)